MEIIDRLYRDHPQAHAILIAHSEAVARKGRELALNVAHLNPDMDFIYEAAMLHDIGMLMTDAPMLGCTGDLPYICHGVEGAIILNKENLPRHALVCERHVGVGLTPADIRAKKFPIPDREMIPLSIEEKIVCVADKFFSKSGEIHEKPLDKVRTSISRYGQDKLAIFDDLALLLQISQ